MRSQQLAIELGNRNASAGISTRIATRYITPLATRFPQCRTLWHSCHLACRATRRWALTSLLGLAAVVSLAGCQRGTGTSQSADGEVSAPPSVVADQPSAAETLGASELGASELGASELGASEHRQSKSRDERMPPPGAEPPVVVQAFLEASRSGQDDLAMELLSNKAREATGREGLALDRAGKASMVYEVGGTEFPVDDKQAAYVTSVWRDPAESEERGGSPSNPSFEPGIVPTTTQRVEEATGESVKVTWILRRQVEGWRIAGMATAVTGEEPLLINFEDPSDLRRIKGEVDGEP